jgi:phage repressor protein C with HTH and peptisase S24 domain
MAEIMGSRLEWLIKDRRSSQSAIARAIGISQPSVGRLISGETRESGKLFELARELKTSPEYLIGEVDDPNLLSTLGAAEQLVPSAKRSNSVASASEDEDDEIVEIEELDLAFGMGGGSYLDMPVKAKPRKFTRGWLRLFTKAPPGRIKIAQGIGDSMAPTIQNADIVIIDTADRLVKMGDQIWAVAYGETGLIKRLRPLPSGGVKIMSDNPLIEAETAYDGELHVIGKVVAVVRRMAG